MVNLIFWKKSEEDKAIISAEKQDRLVSVENVKMATSRLHNVLDKMRETNEDRRNGQHS